MNENVKTLSFVGAAVVALAIGGWANFASSRYEEETVATGPLFASFDDPRKAKSLEIVSFDQDTATLASFKVAQVKGRWSIPSHEGYPADAAKQLGEAAANMIEAKRLDVASEDPSTYEEFGVVDPNSKTLEVGSTGVGKRVTMQDKANKTLADLIIGKQVEGQTDQYYVRIPDQTPVYVASVKTDKFSTKFEDWIEKDLLKLNPIDLKRVAINDYSIDELQRQIEMRSQIRVGYDEKEFKWRLLELAQFDLATQEFEPIKLADDEELNSQKLNDLKTAVDDLKIVDVQHKPAGLAADLKAGEELAANKSVMIALAARGFHLAGVEGGPTEIYSNEGEVRVGMKDGVEYTLRFGRITGGATGEDAEAKQEGEEGEAKTATGANRYIMVTAQFNPELLPPPERQPLPDEQPATEAAGEGEENKSDENKGEDAKAENEQAQEKAGGKPEDAKKKAERERIEKENKRLTDEYEAKVKKGQERAKELSDRFADWYYVISDATYQKIHLGRDAIIQKKTPPAGEAGKDAPGAESGEGKENIFSDELKNLPKSK